MLSKIITTLSVLIGGSSCISKDVKPDTKNYPSLEIPQVTNIDSAPDTPISFGYKTSWFAVPTDDTDLVVSVLGLRNVVDANWQAGFYYKVEPYDGHHESRNKRIFVTPPIDGWTLVETDLNYTADTSENINTLEGLLRDLSEKFGEAQYFGSYRVVDYASWYRFKNGNLVRGYSYAGGANGYYVNKGKTTSEETMLGYGDISNFTIDELNSAPHIPYDKNGITIWPNEEHPALIAEKWSLNPLKLEIDYANNHGAGRLGLLPITPDK